MSATWFDLSEADFNELLRLSRAYYREATRCGSAKAYIAGCVMAGSALEASLVCMIHVYGSEVEAAGFVARRRGRAKPLLEWTFREMLWSASRMGWLPRGLGPDEEWRESRAKIGDYAEALRQTRNLVHASRYLQDHSPSRITKRYVAHYLEVFRLSYRSLVSVVHESLRD